MRWSIRCLLSLGVALSAATARAQSDSAPMLAPPGTSTIDSTQAPAATTANPPAATQPAELPAPASAAPSTDAASSAAGFFIDPPSQWYSTPQWLGPEPWDSGIELGLNGSSGTSDSLSLRAGAYVRRESRFSKLNLSGDYNLTMSRGESTQDNAQIDVCNDWKLDDSIPWTLFGSSNVFYDKFAPYNLQTNLNIGVGYRFIHTPGLDFMGRIGGGTSRDFGGPEDKWVPEGLAGFEYSQRISQTQKFYGKLDYYPEFGEGGQYRLVADSGWEIALSQPSNVSLKISASDRYDSASGAVNPQLLDYSVLLLLKL